MSGDDLLSAAQRQVRNRFQRRVWRRRLGSGRLWLYAVAVVALVLGGGWVLGFSSYTQLHTVTVEGVEVLAPDEVRGAANAQIGDPLLWVDVDEMERRVALLPAVASVEVRREWPDSLVIVVTEREAVGVVASGSTLRGFDADGVIFRSYQSAPRGLPLVTAVGDVDADALVEAATVVVSLPEELRRVTVRIDVASIDHIVLTLRGGRTAMWGSAEDSELKGQVLQALLAVDASSYDVSVPSQPTYRN